MYFFNLTILVGYLANFEEFCHIYIYILNVDFKILIYGIVHTINIFLHLIWFIYFIFKPIYLFKHMLWQKRPKSLRVISPFKGQAIKISVT